MREITTHIVEGDPAPQLKIEVQDEPGAGGANHLYVVSGMHLTENASFPTQYGDIPSILLPILFQNGGIPDHGVNGITNEALLAIVIDRLECFQNGPYPAQENATALSNAREALRALQKRTLARIKRGVEGQEIA